MAIASAWIASAASADVSVSAAPDRDQLPSSAWRSISQPAAARAASWAAGPTCHTPGASVPSPSAAIAVA